MATQNGHNQNLGSLQFFVDREFHDIRTVTCTATTEVYTYYSVSGGQANAAVFKKQQESHTTTLTYITMATATDRAASDALTTTNTTLTTAN